ncbi:MAG: Mov34/MPN/PAD-1 family protein [Anaerolineales bacterium]|nr:MAG: Mov34/MPN/PAD-1 family protein [Anaerolineales bacterium]
MSTSTSTPNKPGGLQSPLGAPRRARLPLSRAQRWLAAGEDAAQPALPVFFTQSVIKTIALHAASDMDNEVGGWLAGRWCRDGRAGTEFVVVEALLPAQQVRSGSTFLTFTHDSQVAMLSALEEQYENKCVVGWYHTHPRMGIFLSGYDTWLHDHFFPQAWQVALVVEPHTRQAGLFVRKDGELSPRRYSGFYELHSSSMESVVDWTNLRAVPRPKPAASATQPPASPKAEPSRAEITDTRPVGVKTVSAKAKVTKPQAEAKPAAVKPQTDAQAKPAVKPQSDIQAKPEHPAQALPEQEPPKTENKQ